MYYKVGQIELETYTHVVKREGTPIHLSPIEFALLEYLFRHANTTCSRDDILDNVWGQRFMYDTGTIDVHLNALRRKLGFSRTFPIETIRGAGLILHTGTATNEHILSFDRFISDWLYSHMGEFESKGLTPAMYIDPFVSELTMSPHVLRTMLDGILAALLPSAQPGTIRVESRLKMTHFTLTIDINGTVNELRIPVAK